MNIVYKMIHLKTPNILNRKESVYDIMKNKSAVSIMDFITIIYNCNFGFFLPSFQRLFQIQLNKILREDTNCVY